MATPAPTVDITTYPPLHLAGMRHVGPYTGVGDVFARLAAWAKSAGLIGPSTRFIGVYYDNPREVAEAELRADACISIEGPIDMPADVQAVDLPGGRHAVVRHVGPYSDLHRTYDWIFGEWLPQSGEAMSGVPYEDYINDPNEVAPAQLITDIYVPVAS